MKNSILNDIEETNRDLSYGKKYGAENPTKRNGGEYTSNQNLPEFDVRGTNLDLALRSGTEKPPLEEKFIYTTVQ